MSRQKTEINPIRAERVKILIDREKITQKELADRIFQTQQNVSRIIQKRQPLTEETARQIVTAFPEYRIEWILGYDDYMTSSDQLVDTINNKVDTAEALNQVIRLVADDICLRENIQRPTIPMIPDFMELQTQLHEYAELIVRDYLTNRDNSRTWKRIDNDPFTPYGQPKKK